MKENIKLKSGTKAPFKFDIDIVIEASKEEENLTALQLIFKAEMNAFVKMMVEKPLTQFLDVLASKMQNF